MARILLLPTAFSLDPSDKAQERIRDERHLAWVRTLPSVLSGLYGCDPCHIRYGDPLYRKKRTGKAQKPDDIWVLPMTREEHRSQHSANESLWWSQQGIDPLDVARKLYAVSGDTEAGLSVINAIRRLPRRIGA